MNENCHNSRTTDDANMELGPVSKLDKRNSITKKISDGVMLAGFDVIITFSDLWPIRSNPEAEFRTHGL